MRQVLRKLCPGAKWLLWTAADKAYLAYRHCQRHSPIGSYQLESGFGQLHQLQTPSILNVLSTAVPLGHYFRMDSATTWVDTDRDDPACCVVEIKWHCSVSVCSRPFALGR